MAKKKASIEELNEVVADEATVTESLSVGEAEVAVVKTEDLEKVEPVKSEEPKPALPAAKAAAPRRKVQYVL